MKFSGRHGDLPGEQERPQPFEVDVELGLDLSAAGGSDDLAATVDYAVVFSCAQRVVTGRRYHLLERLATAIAEEIAGALGQTQTPPRPRTLTVRVRKLQPPLAGAVRAAEVELNRRWP